MVNLKDLAKHCNMSVTQVSRALNNRDDVSEKTKQKVRQAAKELGYVKNIMASNLANKSSRQIAALFDGIDVNDCDSIESNQIQHILKGAHEYVVQTPYEMAAYTKMHSEAMDYRAFCIQRGISGLVIYGCHYDDRDFMDLVDSDFPAVAIDILVEKENKGCVIVNNNFYSQLAVDHLVKNGCRQIALISGRIHSHVTLERESGYRLALHSHGIQINEDYIVCADFHLEEAREKTIKLLREYPCIDGLFCMSDIMAVGCMEAVKSMGKQIPEDIKIFGFDGLSIGNYISPGLSTIRQDFIKKGYRAVELLTQILTNESTEHTVVVPCEPIIRESSGLL